MSRGAGPRPPAESIDEEQTAGLKSSVPISEGICSCKNNIQRHFSTLSFYFLSQVYLGNSGGTVEYKVIY